MSPAKVIYQLLAIVVALLSFSLLMACEGSSSAREEVKQSEEINQIPLEMANASVVTLFNVNEVVTAEATQVNDFLPLIPQEIRTGSCQANSQIVNEAYAWRCQVANEIFDPCLTAADGQTIVCGAVPMKQEGFKLHLSQPLPSPQVATKAIRPPLPWLVELADGIACWLTTDNLKVASQRVSYLCSDESKILGEPRRGEVWTARKVLLEKEQAGWQIKTSEWIDIFAIWRTVDPNYLIEEIGLKPDQIYMDITELAHSLQGRLVPPVLPNPEALPSLSGGPPHLRFSFEGEILAPWVNPSSERQLLIYPVAAYRQMSGSAGIHDIDQQIKRLQDLLAERPEQPGLPLPMLPPLGDEAPDPTTQLKYLDFESGSGIRFITRYTQGARPCNNEEIFYTFQGLTKDGRYYIALFYPISTWALPDNTDTIASEEIEKITADYSAYQQQLQEKLDRLGPADFTPTLSSLDAMVASLQLEKEAK
jgi:hypothetical protein